MKLTYYRLGSKTVILSFFLVILWPSLSHCQSINNKLKKELDSMYVLDQKYRELLTDEQSPTKGDSLAKFYKIEKQDLKNYLWNLQNDIDESNLERMEVILKQHGYPGEKLVGIPSNEAAFFVIQHSPKIDQYLPLLERAASEKQLPFKLFAMMKDRSLMQNEKEQIYGTQASGFIAMNQATGKAEWTWVIWPVADPENVNKRRKEAGFDQTVEENAKRLGVLYKELTIDEVNKMKIR